MCCMCCAWFGGSGGLLFPLPAGRMCAYSLCFPAVAAQVWAGQSSGTDMTLLALCHPWLSACPPDWILLCSGDPFSPPSISIGCRHSIPMERGWEQEGWGQQQVWLRGLSLAKGAHVQSGAEPQHTIGTCFPLSPKAAFLEHLCLSVLILPPQHPHSLCLHELFLDWCVQDALNLGWGSVKGM